MTVMKQMKLKKICIWWWWRWHWWWWGCTWL